MQEIITTCDICGKSVSSGAYAYAHGSTLFKNTQHWCESCVGIVRKAIEFANTDVARKMAVDLDAATREIAKLRASTLAAEQETRPLEAAVRAATERRVDLEGQLTSAREHAYECLLEVAHMLGGKRAKRNAKRLVEIEEELKRGLYTVLS